MKIIPIPCLSDNYAYLLRTAKAGLTYVIDPSESKPILTALQDLQLQLDGILITHHHYDHVGGIEELISTFKGIPVYGGDQRIPHLTHTVHSNQPLSFDDLTIHIHHTPCHTTGHVLYEVLSQDKKALFTGDTLFVGGCGRFFEGNGKDMNHALNHVIASLSDDTYIYPGHEYTVGNLIFAAAVDGDNPAVVKKLQWAKEQREASKPTIPSTIAEEKSYNPFMRISTPPFLQRFGKASQAPADIMEAVRALKNSGDY